MFKTREQHEDPCKRPAVFYFKSVVSGANNRVWTYYIRHNTSGNCSQITVRKNFEEIRVFSEKLDMGTGQVKALRRQCCDIIPSYNKLMTIGIRQCRDDELIAMPV
ncbi:unnamed protein product [Ilex paraguariensis]|uniref:Uncharacterized protein n=1 Tax=Ilex paraguariensis TaxID=185542 RepID=A0ABC8QSQ9_9AQUA